MSELYISKDEFKPLLLPETGEELLEGRQYALTPLARLILHEEFGLGHIPTVVECIKRRVAPTKMETKTTNLETGEVRVSVLELPAQDATFSYARGRFFTLDLKKMDSLVPFYDKSHKLPAFEEDWFEQASLPPTNRRFRGCSLRWWMKRSEEEAGGNVSRARKVKEIDLSILF